MALKSKSPFDDLFDQALTQVRSTIKRKMPPPPPVAWMEENFIDPITLELVEFEDHQKRILRRALMMDEDGYSKYSLVVWSEPKKSGKTTVASAVGAWAACNVEAPNEVSTVANDQEQSAGRIFANMQPTLAAQGWKTPGTRTRGSAAKSIIMDPHSYGPNGTEVHAITTRYEKEAGANQGLSLWSELWAYKGERLMRLWEEMTPPPTRRFSMRWVETYAGHIGENLLLQSIYLRVFKDFNQTPELMPGVTKLWPDLPVYELDYGRTLVYWSHEPRMSWQTPDYYITQRKDMRPSAYMRLHENRWVESAESFITYAMWNRSTRITPEREPATYALDGSKNGDCTALVGCVKKRIMGDELPEAEGIEPDTVIHTVGVHVWELTDGGEVPYAEIERKVIYLFRRGFLKPPLWYDPYQLAYLAQRLRELHGIPCEEFSQAQLRVRSDTFLYKLYNDGRIINLNHPKLKQHIMAASAKDYSDNRIRIIKPDGASDNPLNKVDLAVAQSMAAYKAYHVKDGGWAGSGDVISSNAPTPRHALTLAERVREDVHNGRLVACGVSEYVMVRRILHELSGWYIDNGDSIRAQGCLSEVMRLDKVLG